MRTYFSYQSGLVVLLFGLLAGDASVLRAGDPIIFSSGDKAKAPLTATRKIDPELMKNFDRLATPPVFDNSLPHVDPDRKPDRNRARRAKNARDERNNWMWVDKGDLQEREDEKDSMGIHEALEEENNSGDLTFAEKAPDRPGQPKERDQKQNRIPAHLLSPRQRQLQQEKDEKANQEAELRDAKDSGKNSDPRLGAHMTKELDLRKLLGPSETGMGNDVGKDLTLRDLLANSGGPNSRNNLAAERSQQMKGLLNLPTTDVGLSTRVQAPDLRPNFDFSKSGTPLSGSDPRTDPRYSAPAGPPNSFNAPTILFRSRVPDVSASSLPREYDARRDSSPNSRSITPFRGGDLGRLPDLPRRGGTLNR